MQTQFEYSAHLNDAGDTCYVTVRDPDTECCDYFEFPLAMYAMLDMAAKMGEPVLLYLCNEATTRLRVFAQENRLAQAQRAEDMGNAEEIAQLIEETFAGRWNADLPVSVRVGIGSSSVVKGFKI